MTVVVSFIQTKGVGSLSAPGIGRVRVRENLTIPATTSASVQDGEIVVVGNAEGSMVAVAFGTVPDGAATAESLPSTSAGYPVASGGVSDPFVPPVGSKINVKAVT